MAQSLHQVVASYRRQGWAHNLPASYVDDHMHWRQHAELDLAFESDIMGRPVATLQRLAAALGLPDGVDCRAVLRRLAALPVPERFVDPVTKLWPTHLSPEMQRRAQQAAAGDADTACESVGRSGGSSGGSSGSRALDEVTARRLMEAHAEYNLIYGYS